MESIEPAAHVNESLRHRPAAPFLFVIALCIPHVGLPYRGGIEIEWGMKIRWLVRLLKKTAMKWWNDNALRLSAALSFYTLFSLAPLLTLPLPLPGWWSMSKSCKTKCSASFKA